MTENVELFCEFLEDFYEEVDSNNTQISGTSYVDNFPYHTVYFEVVGNKLFEQGNPNEVAVIHENEVLDLGCY
jgi:hypothetical protein